MRVAFTTLGCRLNQFETEGMARAVRVSLDQPEAIVDFDAEADVYVINSCTVTARAEQKCRQLARGIKRRHPQAKVMVVGCYAQLRGADLLAAPEVDAVLGNEEKRALPEYLERVRSERFAAVGRFARGLPMAEEWIDEFGDHARATVKVQEGCNLRCTFCAIWKARGPSRSRPPRHVVEQVQRLAARGYEEVVLAGVHLGHYGRDLTPSSSLHDLLDMLLEVVDPAVRIRLSSIDPSEVDASMVQRLVDDPRLCRYLHLPLQSGSNNTLRAMRRAYGVEYYAALVEQVAQADPLFGVGADIIVGFPGETDDDFEATYDLLRRLPVTFFHVFPYSDRPGTSASLMAGKVPRRVVNERSARLRELGDRKKASFLQAHVGGVFEGVLEQARPGGQALLDDYAMVACEAPETYIRRRLRIRVERMENGTLYGRVLEPADVSSQTEAGIA